MWEQLMFDAAAWTALGAAVFYFAVRSGNWLRNWWRTVEAVFGLAVGCLGFAALRQLPDFRQLELYFQLVFLAAFTLAGALLLRRLPIWIRRAWRRPERAMPFIALAVGVGVLYVVWMVVGNIVRRHLTPGIFPHLDQTTSWLLPLGWAIIVGIGVVIVLMAIRRRP